MKRQQAWPLRGCLSVCLTALDAHCEGLRTALASIEAELSANEHAPLQGELHIGSDEKLVPRQDAGQDMDEERAMEVASTVQSVAPLLCLVQVSRFARASSRRQHSLASPTATRPRVVARAAASCSVGHSKARVSSSCATSPNEGRRAGSCCQHRSTSCEEHQVRSKHEPNCEDRP